MQTPMRRAGGKKSGGFEPADIPSPRTMWSVYNKKEMATFERCHEKLKSDADAFPPFPPGRSSRLVLLGAFNHGVVARHFMVGTCRAPPECPPF